MMNSKLSRGIETAFAFDSDFELERFRLLELDQDETSSFAASRSENSRSLTVALDLSRGRWVMAVGDLVRRPGLLFRGFHVRAVPSDLDLAIL
jgi:hypothetical protein